MNTEEEQESDFLIDGHSILERITYLWETYAKYQKILDDTIIYNLEKRIGLDKDGRRELADQRMYLTQLRTSITSLQKQLKQNKNSSQQGSVSFSALFEKIEQLLPKIKTQKNNNE